MVVSVELGDVVYLHVILDAVPKADQLASSLPLPYSKGVLHAVASWSVSIVLATLQIIAVMILEFLLEWQSVECTPQGKLAIDLFLGDVEVFDVEEAYYMSTGLIFKGLAYTYRHVGQHGPAASQAPPFLPVVRTD